MMRLMVLAGLVIAANAATEADKTALSAANAVVSKSDVCSDDEWSYLCNKDAWAGAADAVTGGQEIATAALRRALDHTIAHTDCDAADTTCIQTKQIVDAQLLDIPKVINSKSLAQVNDAAGLIHPAAGYLTFGNAGTNTMTKTALYTGATLEVKFDAADHTALGDSYVDEKTLMKWVDASVKNGCDDNDGKANNDKERLAGHKDVRGTAHVITKGTDCTVNKYDGQGRKACQTGAGTYTAPTAFSVGFAYADLTNSDGVAATAADPATTTYRLCMTSPSIADNTVFADTTLTVTAACPTNYVWANRKCVCEAGRYLETPDGGVAQCSGCDLGKTSAAGSTAATDCNACAPGTYGSAGFNNGVDNAANRKAAVSALCGSKCPAGKYGIETIARYGNGHVEGDACANCQKGTYQPETGKANDHSCIACGVGEYALFGAAAGASTRASVCTTDCSAETDATYKMAGSATLGLKIRNAAQDLMTQLAKDDNAYDTMDRCVKTCVAPTPIKDVLTKSCVASCDAAKGLVDGFEGTVKYATAGTSADTITSAAHGFADDDAVYYAPAGSAVIAGLAANTPYFVAHVAANTFKLSTGNAAAGAGTISIAAEQAARGAAFSKVAAGNARICVSKQCGVNQRANTASRTCVDCEDGYSRYEATSAAINTNEIVFAHVHKYEVDDPVQYRANAKTAIAGLVEGQTYYVVTGTANTKIKLSLTPSYSAGGATAIGMTGGAAGNQITRDGPGQFVYAGEATAHGTTGTAFSTVFTGLANGGAANDPIKKLGSMPSTVAKLTTGASAGGKVTMTAHKLEVGMAVKYYPNGKLEIPELTAGKTYYVDAVTTNTFSVSATSKVMGGIAIAVTSGATGNAFYVQGSAAAAVGSEVLGFCEVTQCGAAEHVQSHRCAACPAGKVSRCTNKVLGNTYTDAQLTAATNAAVTAARTAYLHTTADALRTTAQLLTLTNAITANTQPADNKCDHTGMGNTDCVDIVCPINSYVSSNQCKNCPTRTTRVAGSLASGADTAALPGLAGEYCPHLKCPENYFRDANNGCEVCAAGKYLAAGEDAILGTGTCAPNTCSDVAKPALNPATRACEACQAWLVTTTKQTSAAVAGNEITFAADPVFAAGRQVRYTKGSATDGIAGLTDGNTYYVLAGTAAAKRKLSATSGGTALTISDATSGAFGQSFALLAKSDDTTVTTVAGWGGCTVGATCAAGQYLDGQRACQTCAAGKSVHFLSTAVIAANKVTSTGHIMTNGDRVVYEQGGAPFPITGLTEGTEYQVLGVEANKFQLAALTAVGVALAISDNAAATAYGHTFLLKTNRHALYHTKATTATVTQNGDPAVGVVTIAGHGWLDGQKVYYHQSVGAAINGLTATTQAYYVVNKATNTFQLSLTSGGDAIAFGATDKGSVGNSFYIGADACAAVACPCDFSAGTPVAGKTNTCQACATGTVLAAGSLTTAASTCTAITCRANERLYGSRCIKCVLGKKSAGGTATSCDVIQCATSENNGKVVNGACTTCSAGTKHTTFSSSSHPAWVTGSLADDLNPGSGNQNAADKECPNMECLVGQFSDGTSKKCEWCANGKVTTKDNAGGAGKTGVGGVTGGTKVGTTIAASTCNAGTACVAGAAWAVADFAFPAWSAAIGGTYVLEEAYTAAESTAAGVDSDGVSLNAKGRKKRTCTTCPAGKKIGTADTLEGANLGAARCTVTLQCPKNSYLDTDRSCKKCPAGKFKAGDTASDYAGTLGVSMCKSACGVNEYLGKDTVDGVANTITCKACAAGKVRPAGDTIMKAGGNLAAGAAPPVEGAGAPNEPSQTTCAAVYCPDNTVRDKAGNCCACAAGKTRNQANSGAANLAAYEALQLASNLAAPQTCAATQCALNEYVSSHVCTACPAGKTNVAGDDASGADTVCHDLACGKDRVGTAMLYHRFDKTNKKCIACNAWETAPEGIIVATHDADTACTALNCAVNQYVDANHACQNCQAWEESAIKSRAAATTCTVKSCAANEWVDATHADNICRPCPVGTKSTATLRTDTTGIAVCTDKAALAKCAANFYVKNHVCVPCAAGWTIAEGGDPEGADTACAAPAAAATTAAVHTICKENERVQNHACVACPIGTTNAAGDDAHYHDTTCKATICKENERVKCSGTGAERTCVCESCNKDNTRPTEILWTNTAGDDCSKGVDTFCV